MTRLGDHANYLALDVGTVRVGVATASAIARLPHTHSTLPNDDQLWVQLRTLCQHEHIGTVIVGLPRGLEGQETAQSTYSREFADTLRTHLGGTIRIEFQDEAVTSKKAEAELASAKKRYAKADIDALAAVYILEDYLKDHPGGTVE
jgi:putative Holliday junction resolvase